MLCTIYKINFLQKNTLAYFDKCLKKLTLIFFGENFFNVDHFILVKLF